MTAEVNRTAHSLQCRPNWINDFHLPYDLLCTVPPEYKGPYYCPYLVPGYADVLVFFLAGDVLDQVAHVEVRVAPVDVRRRAADGWDERNGSEKELAIESSRVVPLASDHWVEPLVSLSARQAHLGEEFTLSPYGMANCSNHASHTPTERRQIGYSAHWWLSLYSVTMVTVMSLHNITQCTLL